MSVRRSIVKLILSVILIFIIVLGFRNCGSILVKDDFCISADNIVILMGSTQDRVLEGADAYNSSLYGTFLIVETFVEETSTAELSNILSHCSNSQQSKRALIKLDVPEDNITILDGGSTSTLSEALVVADYISENHNIDTLLIVTSPEHTFRSKLIFRTVLRKTGQKVEIFCRSSKYSSFDPKRWWITRDGIESVVLEYLKIINFIFLDNWNI